MKGALIYPLTVAFCFVCSNVAAYTLIDGLPYTYQNQNYHWTSIVEESVTSLQLLSDLDQAPTRVEFSWNNNIRSSNHFFDESKNLISGKPNRTLWAPHPTQAQTLEEVFINALLGLDYPQLNIPYLSKDESGNILVSDIEDFLKAYRIFQPTITSKQFLQKIKNQIAITSNHLIFKDHFKNTPLIPSFLNIVEPIRSGTRYDAFNLFPLLTYHNNKTAFMSALKKWTQSRPLNVLKIYRDPEFDLSIRQALLTLLTHNHLVEVNLIRLVALDEGVDKAWEVAKNINQIYLNEQVFWTAGKSRHDLVRRSNPNLLSLLENSHFAPYDAFIQMEGSPVFLMEECQTSNPDDLYELAAMAIPAARSYHLYGSIVTAQKMKNLKIPKTLAEMVNAFLIQQYQSHTKATLTHTNSYIQNLYLQGTHYVYMCN